MGGAAVLALFGLRWGRRASDCALEGLLWVGIGLGALVGQCYWGVDRVMVLALTACVGGGKTRQSTLGGRGEQGESLTKGRGVVVVVRGG